jgi:dihydroxy-acid dehydratase
MGAHPCDGWIGIGNCDKIVPAMYNAMVRLNIPAVYLSGGPMLAGQGGTDLISMFEGVGKHSVGKMKEEELNRLAEISCPGCGSCSGMFTANSMNCLGEETARCRTRTAKRWRAPPPRRSSAAWK